ncbi:ferritin-like domain-containing protein [Amycolatopsis sp. cmx-8-4]|uniref:ferritin-like domain-containing protein n=1 Tax=Amycolatopsis sp. cmx-8-4 TaxID=2790947 RepID=UPI00397E45AA
MNRRDLIHGQATDVSPQLALGALNNRWALAQAGDFGSDLDVLNYALTLEYLESAFYVQGNRPSPSKGRKPTTSSRSSPTRSRTSRP